MTKKYRRIQLRAGIDLAGRHIILGFMRKTFFVALMGTALVLGSFAQAQADSGLHAKLINADGKNVGTAQFESVAKGMLVSVSVEGLSSGWHGVHFHGNGDCSDHADHFKKSGGHMSKEGEAHGYRDAKGPHEGDLPNMWVGKDGTGKADYFVAGLSAQDIQDKDGSALMIHAGPDDYKSQPAGNSGDRVACGIIEK